MKHYLLKRIVPVMMCGLLLTACASLRKVEQPAPEKEEKIVTVTIEVKNAPNQVRAFGLDIMYPADAMTYQQADRGVLLQKGFSLFAANEITAGRVRIGGIEPGENAVSQSACGEMFRLTFKSTQDRCAEIKLTDLKDDIRDWLNASDKHLTIKCLNQ